MLLQSNEGKIRVFPAVPDNWATAFTLLARGAFVVSSEIGKDGSIPGVYIESRKGNICRVVNPWPGSEVSVISLTEPGKKIKYKTDEKNGFEFKTLPGHNYLIVPKRKEDILKQTVYDGSPNQLPKTFYEAMLGKNRNF
jgi:alpha-L-fucosidase 2